MTAEVLQQQLIVEDGFSWTQWGAFQSALCTAHRHQRWHRTSNAEATCQGGGAVAMINNVAYKAGPLATTKVAAVRRKSGDPDWLRQVAMLKPSCCFAQPAMRQRC